MRGLEHQALERDRQSNVTVDRSIYVIFTMNCQPAGTRGAPEGPHNWGQSARAIDGFCTRLLSAGYAVTLFVTPHCARMQTPLFEDWAERGVELGLYLQPQTLFLPPSRHHGNYQRYFGQYPAAVQREIGRLTIAAFQDCFGRRPQSVRTDMHSASDDTFRVLYELGFRQGSVSSPGRRVTKHAAVWTGAVSDPHYVHPTNRLLRGDLPFFEIPVTTDAQHISGGVSPALEVDYSTFDQWHQPLIETQLARMERENVVFRALCATTHNSFEYHADTERSTRNLQALLDYLAALSDRCNVVPATVAAAHASFRLLSRDPLEVSC